MSSNPSPTQTSRPAAGLNPKPSGPTADSTPSHFGSDNGGLERSSEELNNLQRDVASLKDSFARLLSQVGGEAAKSVRSMSQTVASQVGSATSSMADAGSELASSATERAKTFASELESMTRRNPLGTVAGALLVGVIIGMMSRGRS